MSAARPTSPEVVPGARVRFSRDWLRSLGIASGPAAFAEGRVLAIEGSRDWPLALISWRDGTRTHVRPGNLSLVGRRESEAAEWNNARVAVAPAPRSAV